MKFDAEDAERLREAAARLAEAAAKAWEGIAEIVSEFYAQAGMTAQEIQEALNGAAQAAQEAEKQQRQRKSIYRPPKRPQKAISAVCKSNPVIYRKGRPTARSSPRRGGRKQG